jgi:PIN domain nuclease of toxin-antitoxin system
VVNVYLDTDCILALVKDSDWLKESVKRRLKSETKFVTSVLTVIECRLVLLREATPEEAFKVEKVIKNWKIQLIPLNENILKRSKSLMQQNDFLGTFDSIHIATSLIYQEPILSTDHVFSLIPELVVEDPRG